MLPGTSDTRIESLLRSDSVSLFLSLLYVSVSVSVAVSVSATVTCSTLALRTASRPHNNSLEHCAPCFCLVEMISGSRFSTHHRIPQAGGTCLLLINLTTFMHEPRGALPTYIEAPYTLGPTCCHENKYAHAHALPHRAAAASGTCACIHYAAPSDYVRSLPAHCCA